MLDALSNRRGTQRAGLERTSKGLQKKSYPLSPMLSTVCWRSANCFSAGCLSVASTFRADARPTPRVGNRHESLFPLLGLLSPVLSTRQRRSYEPRDVRQLPADALRKPRLPKARVVINTLMLSHCLLVAKPTHIRRRRGTPPPIPHPFGRNAWQ